MGLITMTTLSFNSSAFSKIGEGFNSHSNLRSFHSASWVLIKQGQFVLRNTFVLQHVLSPKRDEG